MCEQDGRDALDIVAVYVAVEVCVCQLCVERNKEV